MGYLLAVVLLSMGLAGCAGVEPPVRSLSSGLTDVLAYRYETDIRDDLGGSPSHRYVEGILYLERESGGTFVVHGQDDRDETRFLPIGDREAVRLYFPDPSQQARAEPHTTRWRVAWDAGAAGSRLVGLDESVARRDVLREAVSVRFDRSGASETQWPPRTLSFTQSGEATFDEDQGFYLASTVRSVLIVYDRATGERRQIRQHVHLEYDAPLSRARARDARANR